MLPNDFPDGMVKQIHASIVVQTRLESGKEVSPVLYNKLLEEIL
jgi:hypothetical protein